MCIAIAFLLLGLLEGVNAGFAKAIADAHRDFLVTNTRVRGGALMPISAMAKIQSIPGVKEVVTVSDVFSLQEFGLPADRGRRLASLSGDAGFPSNPQS